MYSREISARLGQEGERRVAAYLRRRGYIIVKRNYRDRFGEIDIIAESEKEIVFVEVKTRTAGAMVSGAAAVDPFKQKRIRRTAMLFLKRLRTDCTPRFDVAEVTVTADENNRAVWRLRYLKNAF